MAAPTRFAPPVTNTTLPCTLFSPTLDAKPCLAMPADKRNQCSTLAGPLCILAHRLNDASRPTTPHAQKIMSVLPTPSEAALSHSQRLVDHICQRIAHHQGWLSFADYMEAALYAPGLGYYSGGSAKFGGAGDFTTAPEMTPLFGRTLARQLAQALGHTAPNILEFGAGSGKLARDILLELEQLGQLPERYYILDLSAELRERQWQTLQRDARHLLTHVEWLNAVPDDFTGIMLGNEVLDAMPAHLVQFDGQNWSERGVIDRDGMLALEDRPIEPGVLLQRCMELDIHTPYTTEISLANRGFMATLANHLRQGLILLIDYGFGKSEYYHPQRNQGTLMCHYRHHAHGDALFLPGLQDITVHVDFSAITDAAIDSELDLLGYTTQASFLLNAGITELLQTYDPNDIRTYLPLASATQKLLSPAEMGELFKAIAFGKDFDAPLQGFATGDRSRAL